MKEDVNQMWLQSQDDAEGMRLGFTTQQHYFAAIVADRCAEIAYEAEPFHSADLIRKAFGVDK